MTDQMKQIWRRVLSFQYEDGLVEIGMGALFVLIGFGQMIVWIAKEQAKPLWIIVASIAMVGLIGGGTILMQRVVTKLKNEISYPRTGYVELPQKKNKRASAFLISFSLAIAISLIFSKDTPYEWINHMGLGVGMIMGAIMAYLGAQAKVVRFYFVAAVAIITGFVLVYFNTAEILAVSLVFGIMGVALMIGGGVALNRFMQRPPLDDDDGVI